MNIYSQSLRYDCCWNFNMLYCTDYCKYRKCELSRLSIQFIIREFLENSLREFSNGKNVLIQSTALYNGCIKFSQTNYLNYWWVTADFNELQMIQLLTLEISVISFTEATINKWFLQVSRIHNRTSQICSSHHF